MVMYGDNDAICQAFVVLKCDINMIAANKRAQTKLYLKGTYWADHLRSSACDKLFPKP